MGSLGFQALNPHNCGGAPEGLDMSICAPRSVIEEPYRAPVSFKEDEVGNKYPYLDIGCETHGRVRIRLWVSGRLLTKEDDKYYLQFPVVNAKIFKTEKGNYVLRPAQGFAVHVYSIPCGFRGSSYIEILEPKDAEVFEFKSYRSALGRLGISTGVLIVTKADAVIKVKWWRTG